jgi:hypothetical protein
MLMLSIGDYAQRARDESEELRVVLGPTIVPLRVREVGHTPDRIGHCGPRRLIDPSRGRIALKVVESAYLPICGVSRAPQRRCRATVAELPTLWQGFAFQWENSKALASSPSSGRSCQP